MRILFVSNSFPNNLSISTNPSIGGTQRRLDMFIAALREIGSLDILFYVPSHIPTDLSTTAQIEQELSDYWQTKINLFLCPRDSLPRWRQQLEGMVDFSKQASFFNTNGTQQLQAFEQCLQRQPDVIFIQRLQSIKPALTTRQPLPPIIYDIDDIEHLKLIRQLQQPPIKLLTSFYYAHVPALWWGEAQAVRRSQCAFVCSERDRDYLTHRCNLPNVVSIPNAIPIPDALPLTPDKTLLLIGSFHYPPNAQAANFLIEEVMPNLRQHCPEVKLIVAGINPHYIRGYDTNIPNVEFTGFVNHLETLYQRSRVICCPIFSGGGTRIKAIEAATYGKPMVSTEIGVEGLDLKPGQDYLLANTAPDFVNACLKLIQDDAVCMDIGKAARLAAMKRFDLNRVKEQIQKHILDAVAIDCTTYQATAN